MRSTPALLGVPLQKNHRVLASPTSFGRYRTPTTTATPTTPTTPTLRSQPISSRPLSAGAATTNNFVDLTIDDDVDPVPVPSSTSNSSFVSVATKELVSSETAVEDDDDVIIDEEMTNKNVCLGVFKAEMIILNKLDWKVDEMMEPMFVYPEGRNHDGDYSIRVSTQMRRMCGWVMFSDTKILAPLIEQKLIFWDALIPRSKVYTQSATLNLILYTQPVHVASVGEYLSRFKKLLTEPPFFRPDTRYQNPHAVSKAPLSTARRDLPFAATTQTSYTSHHGATSAAFSEQAQRDISMLLDSIPNEVNDEDVTQTGVKGDEGVVEGLNIRLMKHQIQGVAWMARMEQTEFGRGGILADDMGLGKTIQTLALIVNAAAVTQPRKPTLIVSPLSLIRQWESEIQSKSKQDIISVYVHHGSGRTKDHTVLEKYDVIITTYQVVASEYPEQAKKKRKKGGAEGDGEGTASTGGKRMSGVSLGDGGRPIELMGMDPSRRTAAEEGDEDIDMMTSTRTGPVVADGGPVQDPQLTIIDPASGKEMTAANGFGPLFRVRWFRIVLDEAQQIKNKNTRSAISCSALEADRRWCLTGTPIQNNVDELYSLLRFLRIKPLCVYHTFKEQISKPIQVGNVELAMKRLQAVLKATMLRRTKKVLKENHERMKIERDGSRVDGTVGTDSVEADRGVSPNMVLDNDAEESNHGEGHPLIKREMTAIGNQTNESFLNLPARNIVHVEVEFDSQEERSLYQMLDSKTKNQFKKMVNGSKLERNYLNMLCMLLRLRQACDHPQLVFKALGNDADSLEFDGTNGASSSSSSPATSKAAKDAHAKDMMMQYAAAALGWNMSETSSSIWDQRTKEKRCDICTEPLSDPLITYCKDCQAKMRTANSNSSSKADPTDTQEGFDTPPSSSTKIIKLLEILNETRRENPGQKTIVFSQFTSMLDLMESPLQAEGFKFCRYDGSMPNNLREKSIDALRNDPHTTIMLISLKCGSLGLNLTAANRVVLMDVWWNPAVENQAIDRVHRIGQRNEVYVTRLTIKGTVEDRIIVLQEKKRKLADGALGDSGMALKNNKLTMQEIRFLFGGEII